MTSPQSPKEELDRIDAMLLDELSADLKPVRRAPSLWLSLLLVAVAWCAVLVWATDLRVIAAGLVDRLRAGPAFGVALFGLLGVGVGGVLVALSETRPGHAGLSRAGRQLGGAGLALGCGVGVLLALWVGFDAGAPRHADMGCMTLSSQLGLVVSLVAFVLCLRGWALRPGYAAAAAMAGSAALGALVVHLLCPYEGPRHVLLGHSLVPLVFAAVTLVPVSFLFRRFAR